MGGLVSGCARPWVAAYRQAAHPQNAWVPGVSRLEPVETTGPPAAALAHWEAAHCFGSVSSISPLARRGTPRLGIEDHRGHQQGRRRIDKYQDVRNATGAKACPSLPCFAHGGTRISSRTHSVDQAQIPVQRAPVGDAAGSAEGQAFPAWKRQPAWPLPWIKVAGRPVVV